MGENGTFFYGIPWTPDEDAYVQWACSLGYSCSQIAGLLRAYGFPARTKNAVIGRLHRKGFRKNQIARVPAQEVVVRKPPVPKPKPPRPDLEFDEEVNEPIPPIIHTVPPNDPVQEPLQL